MKKMKFLTAITVGILTAGLLAGCSQKKNNDQTAVEKQEPLKVAMDLKYPPFTGTDSDGNPEGLEVDIANAFGEYMGREVEIINTDFSMLITALETGEADIVISDMTVKEERKEKVDFSDPYMFGRTLALVNKEFAEKNNVTDAMTPEEFFALPDARFVGIAGTIAVTVPQSFGKNVEEVTEVASALMEINQGNADILVGANTILGCHASYPDTTIVYSGITEYSESAMAVKKGNTELLDQANAFIKTLYEDGGLYAEAGDNYDQAIGEYLQDGTKGLSYIIYPPDEGKGESE